jgi:hypothetical protein
MKRDENGVPIPETDLPWRKDDGKGICGIYRSSQYCVTTSTCFRWPDDRNYAIHAANCFPQLVAALEDALRTCEGDMQHILDNGRLRCVMYAALEAAKGGA